MPKHFRDYDATQVNLGRPSKTDYTKERPTPQDKKRIKLLNTYVKHDDGPDGRELCWIIHEKGEVCRKVEGHE